MLTLLLAWLSPAFAAPAADLPASWDQCYCAKPTNDPLQPYRSVLWGAAPGCAEPWRPNVAAVYFSCDDSQLILKTRCQCRRGGRVQDRVGAAECSEARRASPDELMECSKAVKAVRLDPALCYCVRDTGNKEHPREAARYNWTQDCLLRRYDGKAAALPGCREASEKLGRCQCLDAQGRVRALAARPPECALLRYVRLALMADDRSAQVELPLCAPADALDPL